MHSGPLCFRREISPPSCSPSRGLFLQNMEVTWRVTRFHQSSLCRRTKNRSVWNTCGVSGPTDELFKTHQTLLFSICWLGCAEEGIHRSTCSPSPSHPSPLSLNKTRTSSSGDMIKISRPVCTYTCSHFWIWESPHSCQTWRREIRNLAPL